MRRAPPEGCKGKSIQRIDRHPAGIDRGRQLRPTSPPSKASWEVIQAQLARLPTRRELAQTALLATLTAAAIVLAGIEALFR
jgi:hypothetical protein